jgi:hypothetical protein
MEQISVFYFLAAFNAFMQFSSAGHGIWTKEWSCKPIVKSQCFKFQHGSG